VLWKFQQLKSSDGRFQSLLIIVVFILDSQLQLQLGEAEFVEDGIEFIGMVFLEFLHLFALMTKQCLCLIIEQGHPNVVGPICDVDAQNHAWVAVLVILVALLALKFSISYVNHLKINIIRSADQVLQSTHRYLLFAVFNGTSQVVKIIPLEGDNADHAAQVIRLILQAHSLIFDVDQTLPGFKTIS
jgi:hypothetical protein